MGRAFALALVVLTAVILTLLLLTAPPAITKLLPACRMPDRLQQLTIEDAAGAIAKQTDERRTAIVFIAYHRGGSTFTGDMLNVHPDVFYLYEPLRQIWQANKHLPGVDDDVLETLALQALPRFLLCQFSDLPIDWFVDGVAEKKGIFARNSALVRGLGCEKTKTSVEQWQSCPLGKLTVGSLERECLSRVVATKLIRPTIGGAILPLLDDSRLHVKVVHLVRDPRGLLASVHKLPSTHPDHVPARMIRAEAKRICARMRANMFSAEGIRSSDYLLLRYEDAAIHTASSMEELHSFAGLASSRQLLESFVAAHTGPAIGSNYHWEAVRENSTATALSWTMTLGRRSVIQIENVCSDVLQALGYKRMYSR
ncbi:PREDICTED: carbohydrate sulfotransferase 3-like [Priapulus caudatus]|uniref:Carbohydrate sulfotransferase 3-like n=1 Tax=Priapulus caudatus TaxID=37621 RepID=A0ABM1F957_PRICU|nr:PREDICTED: carbohydrate sulfotransferase 3-like [Priapulus caudatus]